MTQKQFDNLKLTQKEKLEIADTGYYYRDDEIEEYHFGEVGKIEYVLGGQIIAVKDVEECKWLFHLDTSRFDRIGIEGVERVG